MIKIYQVVSLAKVDPQKLKGKEGRKVPPRFELGSLDSESRVLTVTPWDLDDIQHPKQICDTDMHKKIGAHRPHGSICRHNHERPLLFVREKLVDCEPQDWSEVTTRQKFQTNKVRSI